MSEVAGAILGEKIKNRRKEKDITLKQLAEDTELSVGYLSKIEHGQNNPTIFNLQKICYALNITINDLISEEYPLAKVEEKPVECSDIKPKALFLGRENHSLIYNYNDVFKLESILSSSSEFKVDILTLGGSGEEYSSSKHRYDELGIITRGVLEIKIDSREKYALKESDAILISKNTEHTIRKLSAEDCTSIWIKISK